MMFQGMQQAMQQQPQLRPGQPMPGMQQPQGGHMQPPQGARPPMPGGPGGQGNPWQGMGNGWLQQLKSMGAQMGAQPQQGMPPQGDPTIRGPQAMHGGGPNQAQQIAQQGQMAARQQGQGMLDPNEDPRMRGVGFR